MQFHNKLTSQMEHVMLYEDPNLQTKARSCIPMDELDRNAQSKLDVIKVFIFHWCLLKIARNPLLYVHSIEWSYCYQITCGHLSQNVLVTAERGSIIFMANSSPQTFFGEQLIRLCLHIKLFSETK